MILYVKVYSIWLSAIYVYKRRMNTQPWERKIKWNLCMHAELNFTRILNINNPFSYAKMKTDVTFNVKSLMDASFWGGEKNEKWEEKNIKLSAIWVIFKKCLVSRDVLFLTKVICRLIKMCINIILILSTKVWMFYVTYVDF